MNTYITKEDVLAVIKSFIDINAGDDATINLLINLGAEMLDVSPDTFFEMLNEVN